MNDRALAIAVLCSHLCVGDGIVPLEPKEYSTFAAALAERHLNPEDLFSFTREDFLQQLELTEEQTARFLRLMDRSGSLGFEISRFESMGITILTRADTLYPKQLKKKLKQACPPLFYTAGDLTLLDRKAIGYVGSRSIGEADIAFTRKTVRKTTAHGFAVVSGGAKGTDSVAEAEVLSDGGTAVAFLSDSLLRKLKNAETIRAIQSGRLALLSVVKPDAGFNTGIAMMRNRYIYAQSEGTIVIKADYNKGGTWNGALENLTNCWAIPMCWDHRSYPGNKALIDRGAFPVSEDWDGTLEAFDESERQAQAEQLTIFDL